MLFHQEVHAVQEKKAFHIQNIAEHVYYRRQNELQGFAYCGNLLQYLPALPVFAAPAK